MPSDSSMDDVWEYANNHDEIQLYDFPVLYEFIYSQRFNYGKQFEIVADAMQGEGITSVLEVGCGVGFLLERLPNEFSIIHGIDESEAMANRAEERTQFPVFSQSVLEYDNQTYDGVISLGAVTGHMDKNTIRNYFEHINSLLNTNGRFLVDFFDNMAMTREHTDKNTFSSELYPNYIVERDVETIHIVDTEYETNFKYHIKNTETGEVRTVSESMEIQAYTRPYIRKQLRKVGFDGTAVLRRREDHPSSVVLGWSN